VSAKRTAKPSKKRDKPARGRASLARMRRASEAQIARTSPPELRDLPEDFWDEGKLVEPVAKQPISLRVDTDVLEWFKQQGPRYQSRMNAVLRAYMSTRRRASGAA
jgi:uncharacterized protein (DUF4415 family)